MYLWNRVWGRNAVNHKVPYGTPPRKHNNVYSIYVCIPTHPPIFHVSIVSSNGWMPLKCYVFVIFPRPLKLRMWPSQRTMAIRPLVGTIYRNARRVQVSASAVLLHLVFLKTRQMEMAYFMMFTASITLSLKMYVSGGRGYVSSIHFSVARFY